MAPNTESTPDIEPDHGSEDSTEVIHDVFAGDSTIPDEDDDQEPGPIEPWPKGEL